MKRLLERKKKRQERRIARKNRRVHLRNERRKRFIIKKMKLRRAKFLRCKRKKPS